MHSLHPSNPPQPRSTKLAAAASQTSFHLDRLTEELPGDSIPSAADSRAAVRLLEDVERRCAKVVSDDILKNLRQILCADLTDTEQMVHEENRQSSCLGG